jgi:hypothetical protein
MIYTIEIRRQPIVVLGAESEYAVQQSLQETLGADLQVLTHRDRPESPLWSGAPDEVAIREATLAEIAQWKASRTSTAIEDEENAEPGEDWIAFLVPVSDPTDEEE